jgi:hypothetical protein
MIDLSIIASIISLGLFILFSLYAQKFQKVVDSLQGVSQLISSAAEAVADHELSKEELEDILDRAEAVLEPWR